MAQEAIRALLREKRDVQRQFIEMRRAILQSQRQQGVLDGFVFMQANLELLNLELELAETSTERRPILEKMLKEAREIEEILRQMRASGTAPESTVTDILHAKVERLNIQIQLEETKAKK